MELSFQIPATLDVVVLKYIAKTIAKDLWIKIFNNGKKYNIKAIGFKGH